MMEGRLRFSMGHWTLLGRKTYGSMVVTSIRAEKGERRDCSDGPSVGMRLGSDAREP